MPERLADGGIGICGDEVGDGLSLRQIDAPMQEGPQRHLARLSATATQRQRRRNDALQDQRRAMRVDLDGIFAGIAVRPAHECDHALIQRLSGGGIDGMAEIEVM